MARGGKRACLVDLDLRRPYLGHFFKIAHARGVTDVALDLATLDGALTAIDLPTGLPREHSGSHHLTASLVADGEAGSLDVLLSGPLPPDPGEFVGTRKLAEILIDLRERYDVVVIDSPPLLRVGDALTLSSRVDGLLVVTRLNLVRRPLLVELRRALDAAPATKLGYVITGSSREAAYTGSYGYSYGYDEAYYSRHYDRPARDGHGGADSSTGRGRAAREEETV